MDTHFDVIVIGAGPAGYVAAIKLAQLGKKTACVEKEALGGTCLNVGCIPSKSLLSSTELFHKMSHEAKGFGINVDGLSFDYPAIQARKEKVVTSFTGGIGALFAKNKVTHIKGEASFTSPTSLTVAGTTYTADTFLIATGSAPISLPFLPIDETTIVSSTGALRFPSVPSSLIVVGAGIIGVELGSVYARLGTKVTVIEFLDTITPTLDASLSKALMSSLTKQGITFQLKTKVTGMEKGKEGITLLTEGAEKFSAEKVLVAIGRKPFTEGLGLDKAGITPDPKGRIPVNGAFRTSALNIYAIGDVIDGPMLAHKASEEGIAVAEHIAGKTARLDYITIPSVVYTMPEVAGVGFTEEELKAKNIPYTSGQFPFKANSRAKCTGEETGFVKLLASKSGHLLGAHIIGAHAGELIQELALALKLKATIHDIAETSHAHPTLSEAIKEAALALIDKPIHL